MKIKPTPTPDPQPGRPTTDPTAADHHIHLRVTPQRKGAYTKAAQRSPLRKLTAWMQHHLDGAAEYKPPPGDS